MTTAIATTNDNAVAHRRTRMLEIRVRLTEEEITDHGRKLASKRSERSALDDKRKAVNKDYGGQLAQLDAELDRLTASIETGHELRPVSIYEEWRAGVIEIRRVDSDEVIDTRIPTLSEQQGSLPGIVDDGEEGPVGPTDDGNPAPDGDAGDAAEGDDLERGDMEDQFDRALEGDGDDFGGAAARKAGKLEIVRSATGGEVAHMPDDADEGEAPAEEPVRPTPAKATSKPKKKGAKK